jgi:hypothetical protein
MNRDIVCEGKRPGGQSKDGEALLGRNCLTRSEADKAHNYYGLALKTKVGFEVMTAMTVKSSGK